MKKNKNKNAPEHTEVGVKAFHSSYISKTVHLSLALSHSDNSHCAPGQYWGEYKGEKYTVLYSLGFMTQVYRRGSNSRRMILLLQLGSNKNS